LESFVERVVIAGDDDAGTVDLITSNKTALVLRDYLLTKGQHRFRRIYFINNPLLGRDHMSLRLSGGWCGRSHEVIIPISKVNFKSKFELNTIFAIIYAVQDNVFILMGMLVGRTSPG
jgi:hypothetical protein